MRQSVRVLGWTVSIATLVVTLFLGTVVYSMVQTILTQGFSFESFQPYIVDEEMVLSLFLSINNSGYYDISDLNITTWVREETVGEVSQNSSIVDVIKAGGEVTALNHNISINLEQASHLLFEDGNFTIDMSLEMKYAQGFSFQVETPSMTVPWGAPFYNLSVGESVISQNVTHFLLAIPLSFENHAGVDVAGVIRLDVYNSTRDFLGSGNTVVDVVPGFPCSSLIEVHILIEKQVTENGYLYIYFESPMFSFGPVEKTYG